MTIATKFGYQFLGKPPESYRAKCGGSKGIKIVGDETDLTQLRDWNVEIKQARLITAEDKIVKACERDNRAEIPQLAAETAELYAGVDARLGVAGIWYEIPPIMPAVTPWTSRWYAAAASAFRRKGLRSVVFGFATGTPQVAPWAGQNGHGPDEWPQLYDCLAVLHSLGTDWVRIGVEEYIIAGLLNPGDWSNVGRIKEIYERHIRPNGWNIVFRGIEAGYDVPGMLDAGITPHNLLTGNKRGDMSLPDGGLAAADARYASLPYVDCMFLYQVSDPVVFTDEAKFAFTPGNKNTPVGYLETMQGYFTENPPAPYVAPKPNGTPTTPPSDPKPDPDPEPVPVELVVNGDFSGGTYSVPGNPDQRVVPSGWKASETKVRTEIERDPRFPVSARIIEAYEKREIGLLQEIAVTPGATYRITARVAGWCTADASSPFSPSTSDATIRLRVNGTEAGSLPVQLGDLPTTYGTITRDVVATVDKWAVQLSIKPQYAMQRTDLRIDSVSVVKVKEPAPQPKGDREVLVLREVNHRAQPSIASTWLGTFRQGAKPIVTGDVVNGYVREKFYGVWILAANLKGV